MYLFLTSSAAHYKRWLQLFFSITNAGNRLSLARCIVRYIRAFLLALLGVLQSTSFLSIFYHYHQDIIRGYISLSYQPQRRKKKNFHLTCVPKTTLLDVPSCKPRLLPPNHPHHHHYSSITIITNTSIIISPLRERNYHKLVHVNHIVANLLPCFSGRQWPVIQGDRASWYEGHVREVRPRSTIAAFGESSALPDVRGRPPEPSNSTAHILKSFDAQSRIFAMAFVEAVGVCRGSLMTLLVVGESCVKLRETVYSEGEH